MSFVCQLLLSLPAAQSASDVAVLPVRTLPGSSTSRDSPAPALRLCARERATIFWLRGTGPCMPQAS